LSEGQACVTPDAVVDDDERIDTYAIVARVIAPRDPVLARRIMRLLWAYERSRLRHRVMYEPMRRRNADRPGVIPAGRGG